MPQIEVMFDIDANGILHVSAKDKGTGKENKITIKANSGLSEDEINRMVQDAAAHAEDDKKAHELVDTRNQCDAMVHSVKKALAEHGDKIDAEEKGKIETAIKEAEESLKSNDKTEIEAKTQALAAVSQKLGEKVYAESQQATGGAGGSGGGDQGGTSSGGEAKQDDGDVVDAEFTEVKDKKA
jgi:molecular chaperone DnaK